ncbi:MAG: cytochrome c [Casimicrobiaceae bacterium]
MRQKLIRISLLTGAVAVVVASVAVAQSVTPDRAIKYRQGVMGAQYWHLRFMNAMVKGDRPFSKEEFLTRATYVEELSHMAWEGFPPGSDQGAPTKAKPELWKEPAKFKQYQDQFQAAAAKLVAASRTATDVNAVKQPFADVDKACDNCHSDFRSK